MRLFKLRHPAVPYHNVLSLPAPSHVPEKLVLPLESRWGMARPVVKKGDAVVRGQCLGRAENPLIPPLSAPVGGRVSAIASWPSLRGKEAMSLVLEVDESERSVLEDLSQIPSPPLPQSSPLDNIGRIHEAGIREVDDYAWPLALRVAAPDLVKPLMSDPPFALTQPIDTLIINGLDRQPGIFVRSALFGARQKDLVDAAVLLKAISGAARTVFTVAHDQDVSGKFRRKSQTVGFEIMRCPRQYPQALEPLLVQLVTGREVPQPAGDSRLVGTAVIDVRAALAALESVRGQHPANELAVQVSGFDSDGSGLVRVIIGTMLEDLLRQMPPPPRAPGKIILGGLLLGHSQFSLNVPLLQDVDSVIVQDAGDLTQTRNDPCINCGSCVQHCPMRLLPNEIGKYCEYGLFEEAESIALFHCIECGICGYVCPARRPMTHLIRHGKQEIQNMRKAS